MIHLRTGKAAAPEMQFLFGKVKEILDKATDHLSCASDSETGPKTQ
jgi:hypothetical protein